MSVQYTIEIDALDDWELTHPLPATAYKVMRKLQYLARKERFPERISVPNTVLMSLTGCSEDSLIKARNQLIQAGLIAYEGQKKRTPLYTLHYFSLNPVYNPEITSYEQGIRQGIERGYEQGIKQGIERGYEQGCNNKEDKEEKEEENGVAYMQRCGIKMQAAQYEAIRDFYDCGITDEMLKFACDESAEYGAANFAYIRKIVDGWICAGIKTLEDAKRQKADFEAKKERAKPLPLRGESAGQAAAPKPTFFSERWAR